MDLRELDIIIPVKNEASTIEELLERIHRTLKAAHISYRIIFVDDRSSDSTLAELEKHSIKYPIKIIRKQGKQGKAFSIIEGISISKTKYVAMLDADLQYPPEALPAMFDKREAGMVIANRAQYKSTLLRKIVSRANAFVFGRLLHGMNCDVQSGLKLFKREIFDHLNTSVISAWTIDIPLLHSTLELGYHIASVDIIFEKRSGGASKISVTKTAWEIAKSALKLRFSKRKLYTIVGNDEKSMLGAGFVHNRKRFITHTTLSHKQSALTTFRFWQIFMMSFFAGLAIGGFVLNTLATAIVVVALLSFIYFLDVLFSVFLTLKSLHFPSEITVSNEELAKLDHRILPIYTILCPLYKEAHILPQFIHAISALDWPKHRLEVLLLLEADDTMTIDAARAMNLPEFVKIEIVPDSMPKTKPKACNYGLARAVGSYIVIYDAEDIPEPLQLKKAYLAFQKAPRSTFCLQAKLNYYNPSHNLLTRLFTTEYSLWFDVLLPGLQSLDAAIPLGGTSNHFRTADLRGLKGWDPFNVTEDCDLGMRLFRSGYKTAIIDSITLEEANSQPINWLRQRSRWLKGYLQTYFVHMRSPFDFARNHGIHAFIFQLVVGGKIAFMLINPLLWAMTIGYFALYAYIGLAIESIYPTVVFYMAAFSLVVGNFLYLYNYMIGTAKRGHWGLIKYVFLIPFYWLMVSTAAVMAVYQLIFKPHYWEKTHHGFHLNKQKLKSISELPTPALGTGSWIFPEFTAIRSSLFNGGVVLVAASMIANIFNYLYNAYLFRAVNVEEFGVLSLVVSIINFAQIPLGAFGNTVAHQTAHLFGKLGKPAPSFRSYLTQKAFLPSLYIFILWLVATPLLAHYFKTGSILPFLLISPVWAIGIASSINSGFISGNLLFATTAAMVIVEVIIKLLIAVVAVESGNVHLVYLSLPISLLASFVTGWYVIQRMKAVPIPAHTQPYKLSKKFFGSSLITRLSTIAFFSADMILVKLFLSPTDAGLYALMSLVGKMVYFLGTLFTQFIVPVVSREEGAGRNSKKAFTTFLRLTLIASFTGFIGVGVFGRYTLPFLFPGKDLALIMDLIPLYSLGMAAYAVTCAIVTYHQSKRQYLFTVVHAVIVFIMLIGIVFFHDTIYTISVVIALGCIWSVCLLMGLHVVYPKLRPLLLNITDFFDLFTSKKLTFKSDRGNLRILIFNWRDTKHVWAGGAEVYLHELAKRWVIDGHKVTLFCGNDGKHPRNEVIDGVQVVRRGGFYTVYLWAFLYYILRFKGLFDVVIDSINGIPFFTPLYGGVPTMLLIHHVHQDVFRKHLKFPLAQIAITIESKIIPWIYRNQQVITVSESSRQEIIRCKISQEKFIDVVSPGVDSSKIALWPKTLHPSFLYLGRLKPYKNIDMAIVAFSKVLQKIPRARLIIAGEGESSESLQELSKKLGIFHAVDFLGRIANSEKRRILGEAWVFLHPSSIEGWGITVIEANSCGTPVIGSNVHGLRDSIVHNKTGILIEPGNTDAFAQAMYVLITDQKYRRKLSRYALNWSREFNWDESAQRFHTIIMRELKDNQKFPRMHKVAIAQQ